MKVSYRGHEIVAEREPSLSGDYLLFYSVFRESDGYECLTSVEDSAETEEAKIGHLKHLVDAQLERDDPWDEEARMNYALDDDDDFSV